MFQQLINKLFVFHIRCISRIIVANIMTFSTCQSYIHWLWNCLVYAIDLFALVFICKYSGLVILYTFLIQLVFIGWWNITVRRMYADNTAATQFTRLSRYQALWSTLWMKKILNPTILPLISQCIKKPLLQTTSTIPTI